MTILILYLYLYYCREEDFEIMSSLADDQVKMDDLDFEPELEFAATTEEKVPDGYMPDTVETINRLRCSQCEFLKFKNIDQWKNHIVGHWRLAGMKTEYEVLCFSEDCSYCPKDDNFNERLSKMGEHFIKVHQFTQETFKRCDIW